MMFLRRSCQAFPILTLSILLAPSATEAARGGPDAGGWSWADSRESGISPSVETPAAWTPIGPAPFTDEAVFTVDLTFPFTLYGVTSSRVWFSTNGWMSLVDPGLAAVPLNSGLPSPGAPNATIAWAWDDLVFSLGQVGSTANSDVVELHYYNQALGAWVEGAVEFYRSGALKLAYATTPPLGSLTVGIENEFGAIGTEIVHDGATAPDVVFAAPYAVMFYPPSPLDCSAAPEIQCLAIAASTVGGPAKASGYVCDGRARSGSERVYRVEHRRSGRFQAALGNIGTRDLSLFLLGGICHPGFECIAGGGTAIDVPNLTRGTYYLVVDGASPADDGDFTLAASPGDSDCNKNGVGDTCDILNGTSSDCNADGRPDDCGNCPVDVVFLMDTSGSMSGVATALCNSIDATIATLAAEGIEFQAYTWGLTRTAWACLTDTVANQLGTAVPGPPPPLPTLATLDHEESWAQATAIVAGRFPWTPNAQRVVVPISDEGPYQGNPVNDPGDDRDVIQHAISVSVANDVLVSPITPDHAQPGIALLAQDLAAGTGGTWSSSTSAGSGIGQIIVDLVRDACAVLGSSADAGPDVDLCGSRTITLDGSGSRPTCPAGVEYRWLEGTTELCGTWSPTPTCDVTPTATTVYTLEVRCAGLPSCSFRDSMQVTFTTGTLPADLGNTLLAVRAGQDVVMQWGTVTDAVSYSLFRGVLKGVWPPALLTGLGATTTLPDVPAPPSLYFYRTAGVNCAGQEGP